MRLSDMDFDRWLETELDNFDKATAAPLSRARYAGVPVLRPRNPLAKLAAAIVGSKMALAATATVVLAGAAVGTKAVVTGDPNPLHWGGTVTQQVQTCKADETPGQHGIGQCVSNTAKQHGQAQPSDHPTAPPTAGHPSGPPGSGHPTTPPSSLPTTPPSPAYGSHGGPPSSLPLPPDSLPPAAQR